MTTVLHARWLAYYSKDHSHGKLKPLHNTDLRTIGLMCKLDQDTLLPSKLIDAILELPDFNADPSEITLLDYLSTDSSASNAPLKTEPAKKGRLRKRGDNKTLWERVQANRRGTVQKASGAHGEESTTAAKDGHEESREESYSKAYSSASSSDQPSDVHRRRRHTSDQLRARRTTLQLQVCCPRITAQESKNQARRCCARL
jgi:hypothetical protein